MLFLRPMSEEVLPAVEAWLRLPHVARRWTPDTTADKEIEPDGRPALVLHLHPTTYRYTGGADSVSVSTQAMRVVID